MFIIPPREKKPKHNVSIIQPREKPKTNTLAVQLRKKYTYVKSPWTAMLT